MTEKINLILKFTFKQTIYILIVALGKGRCSQGGRVFLLQPKPTAYSEENRNEPAREKAGKVPYQISRQRLFLNALRKPYLVLAKHLKEQNFRPLSIY